MTAFELAGGSVVGRDHRVVPKNNQDAYWISRGNTTVAVICDGCGSGAHSEVGAALAARLIAKSVRHVLDYSPEMLWDFVERDVLTAIHHLARSMGDDYYQTIMDYFLFTISGVVITPRWITFFGLGDGVSIANGELSVDEEFEDNAPPYLAYQLLPETYTNFYPDELHIDGEIRFNLDSIDHFLIGCDGAGRPGLLQVCEECRTVPGIRDANVGPISQFWEEDRYFSNPVAISRRLKLFARDWPPRDPEHGLLGDDTTIIVGRRVDAG